MSAQTAIVNIGIGAIILVVVSYLFYMAGLILVLRRLGRLSWRGFVPLLNYYEQVRAINAPPRWFALSLPPYVGAVYMGSVAIRLGSVFGRGPAFSLVWLTFGAPVGMFVLAFSRRPLNLDVIRDEAHLFDIKAVKRSAK
jgi:hypothetical protein